jgi:hypothetical protein
MTLTLCKSENLFIEVVLVTRNGHLCRAMVINNELENCVGNEIWKMKHIETTNCTLDIIDLHKCWYNSHNILVAMSCSCFIFSALKQYRRMNTSWEVSKFHLLRDRRDKRTWTVACNDKFRSWIGSMFKFSSFQNRCSLAFRLPLIYILLLSYFNQLFRRVSVIILNNKFDNAWGKWMT